MFLIMDPFFKHYTPQLAHNCCPCHMNYASCNANPGSLALDKSQAVEEAGVITKTIPEDLEKMSIIWSTGQITWHFSAASLRRMWRTNNKPSLPVHVSAGTKHLCLLGFSCFTFPTHCSHLVVLLECVCVCVCVYMCVVCVEGDFGMITRGV